MSPLGTNETPASGADPGCTGPIGAAAATAAVRTAPTRTTTSAKRSLRLDLLPPPSHSRAQLAISDPSAAALGVFRPLRHCIIRAPFVGISRLPLQAVACRNRGSSTAAVTAA